MALDTSTAGAFIQPPPNTPESTSFLRAFETAQERNSPLYRLRLQEGAKQLQQMGMAMQRDQLLYEMDTLKKQSMLEGLQDKLADTPVVTEFFQRYQNDPVGLIDAPMPRLKTRDAQQAVLNAKEAASQSNLAQSFKEQRIANNKLAAELQGEGVDVTSAKIEGRTPQDIQWDTGELARLQSQAVAAKQARELEKVRARQDWRFDPITGEPIAEFMPRGTSTFEPYVKDFEGVPFLVTKGGVHKLPTDLSNREFFTKFIGQALQATSTAQAPGLITNLFNQYQSLPGRTAAPAAAPMPGVAPAPSKFTVGKPYVDKNGNRAAYRGGDPNDPNNWTPLP